MMGISFQVPIQLTRNEFMIQCYDKTQVIMNHYIPILTWNWERNWFIDMYWEAQTHRHQWWLLLTYLLGFSTTHNDHLSYNLHHSKTSFQTSKWMQFCGKLPLVLLCWDGGYDEFSNCSIQNVMLHWILYLSSTSVSSVH